MNRLNLLTLLFVSICLSGTLLGKTMESKIPQIDMSNAPYSVMQTNFLDPAPQEYFEIGPSAKDENETRRRRMFYYGWVVFNIGKHPQSKQTLFISTLRSANCDIRYRSRWEGEIRTRFLEHVKAYYKSELTAYHFRARGKSLGSYWRLDTGNVISGMRARQVRRFTNVVSVPDFVYYCK